MDNSPILPEKDERLNALKSYDILDSLPEADYDDITRLASEICQTPISLISLIDDTRQWFKSNHGLDVRETPREYAFCSHTIANPFEILVVPDSREDQRFAGNPLVTGDPHVIFYAGVPLVDTNGFALGSLCVIDHSAKQLNPLQLSALKILARQIVNLLELRKSNKALTTIKRLLEQRNTELDQMADIVKMQIIPKISGLGNTIRQAKTQLDQSGYENVAELLDESLRQVVAVEDYLKKLD